MNKNQDYLCYAGARALVDSIRAYWKTNGKYPNVWIMPRPEAQGYYEVRSDMVNGCPRNPADLRDRLREEIAASGDC